jgi:multidrug resistance efflux pump
MKHKRPPIPVIVLVVLVVLTALYFLVMKLAERNNDTLVASGTIEAITVTLSPEIGGKVLEIYVEEGDPVQAGQALFRLDDTLLQAQRAVSAAALELARASASTADAAVLTAQASYDLAVAAARAEAGTTRTSDWGSEFGSGISQTEELVAAMQVMDAALVTRDAALADLQALTSAPDSNDFVLAERRLLEARAAYNVAQAVLTRASLSTNADLREAAQTAFDAALDELDAAQSAYDELKDSDPALAILLARAGAAVAQEGCEASRDRVLALQSGDYSLKVELAAAVLNQAQAAAEQAGLAAAQAQASLDLVDAQIAKLTVSAPSDGVILTRTIQVGEVIPAGGVAMRLAKLDDLTITVYIPEDRYGELSLGQAASVQVDSFPGETFDAVISHISDEAEFTPRNVQTVEGRSSTVYAIRLQVDDPEGRLKPGMPADVSFEH